MGGVWEEGWGCEEARPWMGPAAADVQQRHLRWGGEDVGAIQAMQPSGRGAVRCDARWHRIVCRPGGLNENWNQNWNPRQPAGPGSVTQHAEQIWSTPPPNKIPGYIT